VRGGLRSDLMRWKVLGFVVDVVGMR